MKNLILSVLTLAAVGAQAAPGALNCLNSEGTASLTFKPSHGERVDARVAFTNHDVTEVFAAFLDSYVSGFVKVSKYHLQGYQTPKTNLTISERPLGGGRGGVCGRGGCFNPVTVFSAKIEQNDNTILFSCHVPQED